jgi:hypothetical protein
MTKLLGIVTLTEDDVARLEFAHRHPGASQYPKIDRRVDGVLLVDDQGLDAAFQGASSTLERTYTTNSVMHYQLEP